MDSRTNWLAFVWTHTQTTIIHSSVRCIAEKPLLVEAVALLGRITISDMRTGEVLGEANRVVWSTTGTQCPYSLRTVVNVHYVQPGRSSVHALCHVLDLLRTIGINRPSNSAALDENAGKML